MKYKTVACPLCAGTGLDAEKNDSGVNLCCRECEGFGSIEVHDNTSDTETSGEKT